MDKSTLQTAAVIATIVATAWLLGGEVRANSAAIAELREDVRELRHIVSANTAAIAEMRGILLLHIGGHNHTPVIADNESGE